MADKRLQLSRIVDLSPYLDGGEVVAVDVGFDSQLCALVALKKLDYRSNASSGVSFAKTLPDESQSYRLLTFFEGLLTRDLTIRNERFNIHFVQPLPNDQLLLVCARCRRYTSGDFDLNGRIYSASGRLSREILLGDGIARVQTGSSGLNAWDAFGKLVYRYEPKFGLDSICDCYALNVESASSTWLYYYTEFPLVHLQDRELVSHWSVPVHGSPAFAIARDYALFMGGYRKHRECSLMALEAGGNINRVTKFYLIDEVGQNFNVQRAFGRADALYLMDDHSIYFTTVDAAVRQARG
jgi:hypothetical protein